MKYCFATLVLLGLFVSFKPKPAYQIFNGDKAKSIDFDKMMNGLKNADVVFFGETHNNSICHWLELQVLKGLSETTGRKVIVGAEMFESDDQLILDEYLAGFIKEEHLINEAKLWDNYKTDYAPLVEFAKANNVPFIATNIPRRYANIVARNGLEGLDQLKDEARNYIVPLPLEIDYESSGYKEIAKMMAGHMGNGNNMVDAQAIKDATMAHFISKNLNSKRVFYHINGAFHSKDGGGIVYFLSKSNPEINIVTITMVDQEIINELEDKHKEIADFVIAIPSDMTKTY